MEIAGEEFVGVVFPYFGNPVAYPLHYLFHCYVAEFGILKN